MRDLVKQALRMRPDRIVVGEVRGAEVVDLLAALNTGHDGGAGTVHANNPAEVPARFEALAALGGLDRAGAAQPARRGDPGDPACDAGPGGTSSPQLRWACCSAATTVGCGWCPAGTVTPDSTAALTLWIP